MNILVMASICDLFSEFKVCYNCLSNPLPQIKTPSSQYRITKHRYPISLKWTRNNEMLINTCKTKINMQ